MVAISVARASCRIRGAGASAARINRRVGTFVTTMIGMIQLNTNLKRPRKHDVRVSTKIEEAVISVNQTLRANDPETRGRETEQDAVVNHHSHCDRGHVKCNLAGRGNDRHLDKGRDNKRNANERIDEIIEVRIALVDTANWVSIG